MSVLGPERPEAAAKAILDALAASLSAEFSSLGGGHTLPHGTPRMAAKAPELMRAGDRVRLAQGGAWQPVIEPRKGT
jgi:hypothetical protein